jgi:riboflavin synthase
MFTGLIIGLGEVADIAPGSGEYRFTFRPLFPAPAWVKGESIAVNGVCLSVETFEPLTFTTYASRETLQLSNLGSLRRGDKVNLERALALGDRLGGHLVSGHVDGIAHIESIRDAGSSKSIRISFPAEFSAQVIPKGSVALDGISLTINHCGPGLLEVNLIPETRQATTAGFWKTGQALNLETDMLGKYVERMLLAWKENTSGSSRLTMDFLRENLG